MEGFRVIMRIITAGLSLYSLLIMFRILLTWFQGPNFGRPLELLKSVTDPYLSWFRRFTFLRIENFDFSIIVALIVLSIVSSITGRLASAAVLTLGYVLAIILSRVASAVGFFLIFFLVLAVIRVIGGAVGASISGRFWITVDRILEPVVHKVALRLSRGKFVTYQNALLLFSAVVAVVFFVGRFLVAALVNLLVQLPL